MDKSKLKQTIAAAQEQVDLLEQALDRQDYRAIGAALYTLRRKLAELSKMAGDEKSVTTESPRSDF